MTKYSDIPAGGVYLNGDSYEVKGEEQTNNIPEDNISFEYFVYENDLNDFGGFIDSEMAAADRTTGFQGDIISKTQSWSGSSWSKKVKLNEFYLNFGERPDLWPVGPVI